jgi:hypothetical protein
MKRSVRVFLATLVGCFVVPLPAVAVVVVPPGLQPGDTYHLVFVTRDFRDATSPNIADYNAFVQAQANLNPDLAGISWKAIASTETVDARNNALISAPVYNLAGVNIASGFADIWDGSINAPILRDQFMNGAAAGPWTGTDPAGLRFANLRFVLGSSDSSPFPVYGNHSTTNSTWIEQGANAEDRLRPLYALSEKLTVVPEPATIVLGALLIGLVTAIHHRRTR